MSKVWGYVLGCVAVVAIVFGLIQLGKREGYAEGVKAGAASRQAEVDRVNEQYNNLVEAKKAENLATNAKIDALEKQGIAAADQIAALTKQVSEKRTDTITKYIEKYPQQSQQCAVLPETAASINEMIFAGAK